MSVRKFPEPETMKRGVSGVCKWCGRSVAKPAIYWHRECFEEYCLYTRRDAQKTFLIKRDGAECAQCGDRPLKWDARGVSRFWSDGPGYEYWLNADQAAQFRATLWPRPEGRWSDLTEEERRTGEQQQLVGRVCALEVDHRKPLWSIAHLSDDERRPYFGPSNLWLLCPACHKAKTSDEARQRAAARLKVAA